MRRVEDDEEERPILASIKAGFFGRCPACRRGPLFHRYLKVADACAECAEALHHQRADDMPPYVTIVVVGHIVLPLLLLTERQWSPPTWAHLAVWLPLTVALTLWLLPHVKGALVALQWAFRMHGFGPDRDTPGY